MKDNEISINKEVKSVWFYFPVTYRTQNTGEAVAILGNQFGLIPPQYIHGFFTKPFAISS